MIIVICGLLFGYWWLRTRPIITGDLNRFLDLAEADMDSWIGRKVFPVLKRYLPRPLTSASDKTTTVTRIKW